MMARAQSDEIQRTSTDAPSDQKSQTVLHSKSSKTQTSPTFQQLLQREGSKWSKLSPQKQKKNLEVQEDHHNKKSVLAKVKDKAKKWRNSLSGKKRHDKNDLTRLSSAGLQDKSEEDAEFHSARMSESKHTPDKDEPASYSTTNTMAESIKYESVDTDAKNQAITTADALAHDLQECGSRFARLTVSTSENTLRKGDKTVNDGESLTWEKGVSMKEYLMHKFEPGEDERALSQVITQTISPRRDKMREAMSSFLKTEEPSEFTNKHSNSEGNSSDAAKSKPLPESGNLDTNAKLNDTMINPSDTSNASLKLNEAFRSTIASYQNHNLGSSPNHNTSLNKSSATSASPDKTQVSGHKNTNVRRVPVSTANRTQVHGETDANPTRLSMSIGNNGPSTSQ